MARQPIQAPGVVEWGKARRSAARAQL